MRLIFPFRGSDFWLHDDQGIDQYFAFKYQRPDGGEIQDNLFVLIS